MQSALAINFTLPVGALSEIVTVEGGAPLVNTESASVSTVVDRQFAENLPMNGRTFQTLIELTPGVVTTASNLEDGGQFNVNGQRANTNYWTVDGVGANVGISTYSTRPAMVFLGHPFLAPWAGQIVWFRSTPFKNSEFNLHLCSRIWTNARGPNLDCHPIGHESVSRIAFDYLRNDVLDANDWFGNYTGLPKPEERQNDFGGTLSGPILKDRTFFFFSYEGLRLRLPQVVQSSVPDISARQNAIPAMQPIRNASIADSGTPDTIVESIPKFFTMLASTRSQPPVEKADEIPSLLFGRYDFSFALVSARKSKHNLSDVFPSSATTQTGTVGTTWTFSPVTVNDLRVNYSRMTGQTYSYLDSFGGAVPLASLPFPDSFTSRNAAFTLFRSLLDSRV